MFNNNDNDNKDNDNNSNDNDDDTNILISQMLVLSIPTTAKQYNNEAKTRAGTKAKITHTAP